MCKYEPRVLSGVCGVRCRKTRGRVEIRHD